MTKFKVDKAAPTPTPSTGEGVVGPTIIAYPKTYYYMTVGDEVTAQTPTLDITTPQSGLSYSSRAVTGAIISVDGFVSTEAAWSGIIMDYATGEWSGTPLVAHDLAVGDSTAVTVTATIGGEFASTTMFWKIYEPFAGFDYTTTSASYLSRYELLTVTNVTNFTAGGSISQYDSTQNGKIIKGTVIFVDTSSKKIGVLVDGSNTLDFEVNGSVDNIAIYSSAEATISAIEYVYPLNSAISLSPLFETGDNLPDDLRYTVSPDLPSELDIDNVTGEISGTMTSALAPTTYTVTVTNYYTSKTTTTSLNLSFASAPNFVSISNRLLIALESNAEFTRGKYISTADGDAVGIVVKQLNDGMRVLVDVLKGTTGSATFNTFEQGDSVDSVYTYAAEKTKIIAEDDYVANSILDRSVIPVNVIANVDPTALGDLVTNGFAYTGATPLGSLFKIAYYEDTSTDDYVYMTDVVSYNADPYNGYLTDNAGSLTTFPSGGSAYTVYNVDARSIIATVDNSDKFTAGLEASNAVTSAVGTIQKINGLDLYLEVHNKGFDADTNNDILSLLHRGQATLDYSAGQGTLTDSYLGASFKVSNLLNGLNLTITGMTNDPLLGDTQSIASHNVTTGEITLGGVLNAGIGATTPSYKITKNTTISNLQVDRTFYLYRNKPVSLIAYVDSGDNLVYKLDKTLPTGLFLDSTSGIIQGTPSDTFARTAYTMTAYNALGSVTYSFNLQVLNTIEITASTTDRPSLILHRAGQGNSTTPCLFTEDFITNQKGRPISQRLCYLDIGELDLFYNGLNLGIQSGKGMCNYVRFTPYFFFKNQYKKEIPASQESSITCPSRCSALGYCNTTPASTVTCEGDYRSTGGPNCDDGTYGVDVETWTYNSILGTCSSGTVANATTVSCGGQRSNCLEGAGFNSGFTPDNTSRYDNGKLSSASQGLETSWTFSSAFSKGDDTNIRLANFFLPDFQDTRQCRASDGYTMMFGGIIGYSKGQSGTTSYASNENDGMGRFQTAFEGGNPFYRFECLDAAFNTKATILITVREWDKPFTADDYLDMVVPDEGLSANAAIVGDTNSYLMSSALEIDPDGGFINDLQSWNDYVLANDPSAPGWFTKEDSQATPLYFEGPVIRSCGERLGPIGTIEFGWLEDNI